MKLTNASVGLNQTFKAHHTAISAERLKCMLSYLLKKSPELQLHIFGFLPDHDLAQRGSRHAHPHPRKA